MTLNSPFLTSMGCVMEHTQELLENRTELTVKKWLFFCHAIQIVMIFAFRLFKL